MKGKQWALIIVALVVIGLGYGALTGAFIANPSQEPSQEGTYDSFAKCLTEKGAVMYGTYWCQHCKNQKAMFGSSFQYVNYVECTQQESLCQANGIEGYPTWVINGNKYSGEKPLETLASLTGCEL